MWGTFLFTKWYRFRISKPFSNRSKFKIYRFFVISWFDLNCCISVTLRIWEVVWGTFLFTKWYRFRISKPFLNQSKFKIYRFFFISWFDLNCCISVTLRIWEVVWGTFLFTKWYRFRISKPFSNRSKFKIYRFFVISWFDLNCCISVTLRIWEVVWGTFLFTKWYRFRISKLFLNQSKFKIYRFFVISWFDLNCCISVTLRIWEVVWGTFLFTKWCRSRISKPFSNRSKFKIYRFFVISWFDLNCCISVTLRIWEVVWGTFLFTKWYRFRISKPFSNRSKFKIYRFFSISRFDLNCCISVTLRIREVVWGTFLFTKWYRFRISKPFLNQSKFKIYRFFVISWFDLNYCILVTLRIWEVVWGTFLFTKWYRFRISKPFSNRSKFKIYRFFVISWFHLNYCILVTLRIWGMVWGTFLFTKWYRFRISKPFSNRSKFKIYRFFVISWFHLIRCMSVTLRIWEVVWGTFLLAKWCRSRISKPFSNRSKFKIYRFFVISWFDLNCCISVTLRIWEVVWGTFLFTKWYRFRISKPFSNRSKFKIYRFFVISWFDLNCCISVTLRIWEVVWGTFLFTKWYRFRISKPFSNRSKFKIYRFFVISWFDLNCCISVTLRIWEVVWGTFLLAKWCRSRISKPFSNRSKFKIYRFFVISWFDLNCCISVTLRIWEVVWGTFLFTKWYRFRISKPFSNRSKGHSRLPGVIWPFHKIGSN